MGTHPEIAVLGPDRNCCVIHRPAVKIVLISPLGQTESDLGFDLLQRAREEPPLGRPAPVFSVDSRGFSPENPWGNLGLLVAPPALLQRAPWAANLNVKH